MRLQKYSQRFDNGEAIGDFKTWGKREIMGKFKKAQVIILPTKKESDIWSHKGRKLYYQQANFNDVEDEIRYNLYITSDDKIESGDWCAIIDKTSNLYGQFEQHKGSHSRNDQWGKIIATSDRCIIQTKKIVGRDEIGNLYNSIFLPQLSQEFIEEYIENYNKGKIIVDVSVEYNCKTIQTYPRSGRDCGGNEVYEYIENIKINEDNTIHIKLPKDSWTRKEVEKLCRDAWQVGFNVGQNDEVSPSYLTKEDWIKENL